jgi:hypothetical protein
VKKGNVAITQILVQWSSLPESSSTWEDYNVLKTRFPAVVAWGQAGASVGGTVTTLTGGADQKKVQVKEKVGTAIGLN